MSELPTITQVTIARLQGAKFAINSPEEGFLFSSFLLENHYMSYSQRFQDLWVLYETGSLRDGTFVDFGAGDGRNSSNSYLLQQKFGWGGILVEPNVDYDDNLRHHVTDKVHVATGICVSDKDEDSVDFVASFDPSLSTLHYTLDSDSHGMTRRALKSEVRKIPSVTLAKLIGDVKADYLSIDTEGSEYDILHQYFVNDVGNPFTLITVEHNYNVTARRKLFDLLSDYGYIRRFPYYSGHDDWYILGNKCKDFR